MSDRSALVLTAAPESGNLTETLIQSALSVLDAMSPEARWLSQGDAWEATFDISHDRSFSNIRDAVTAALGAAPIDVNIVSGATGPRRKRLLCADMESTIIEQELIDEMASLAGCRAQISEITAAAMRGELDFQDSLRQRVALFSGFEAYRLEELLERATFMPGAKTLVATMRANGAWTALITGGFTLFAERIAAELGCHAVIANALEIENGQLLGLVREPIVGPQEKADALRRLVLEGGLMAAETIAVGDGANDTAMLAGAGIGVAFRAKPILAAQAEAAENGAVIQHGDLTALLYLQGYSRAEFVIG